MNNCIFTRTLVVTLFLLSVKKGNKTGEICKMCDGVSYTDLSQCRASIVEHDFQNLQWHVVLIKINAVTSVNQSKLGIVSWN